MPIPRSTVEEAQAQAARTAIPVKDRALALLRGSKGAFFTLPEIYKALYGVDAPGGQEAMASIGVNLLLKHIGAQPVRTPTSMAVALGLALNELLEEGLVERAVYNEAPVFAVKQ